MCSLGALSFPLPCPCHSPTTCVYPSLPVLVHLDGYEVSLAGSPGNAVLMAQSIWCLGRFLFFSCWHRSRLRPAALLSLQPAPKMTWIHLDYCYRENTVKFSPWQILQGMGLASTTWSVALRLGLGTGSAFMLGAVWDSPSLKSLRAKCKMRNVRVQFTCPDVDINFPAA